MEGRSRTKTLGKLRNGKCKGKEDNEWPRRYIKNRNASWKSRIITINVC